MGKRYTKEEKRDLAKVMANLAKEGLSNRQAADKLNDLGIPMANGGKWTETNLSVFKTNNRRYFAHAGAPVRKYAKRKAAIAKTAKPDTARKVSHATIASILTDPALNSGQIVKMLCAYLDV